VGDCVNLECDILAKYVESFLNKRSEPASGPPITEQFLKERGF
jgi:riboflavin synthase alpha subunit